MIALEMLEERLKEEEKSLISQMSDGHCRTYEDYRYVCGRLHELRIIKDMMLDIEKILLEE